MNLGGGRRSMRALVHKTRNRFETTLATTSATESQMPIVEVVEAPANRGTNLPVGSLLRSLVISVQPTAIVEGRHQAGLFYRPASENVVTPIASYFDSSDPLTEEGVKIRRLAMSKVSSDAAFLTTGGGLPLPRRTFRWKGAKRLYDGDDISLWFLDTTSTTYIAQVWTTFTQ